MNGNTALTMRASALNSILALQLPHSTTFLSRAPLMVRMSPKYCCASLPQFGQGPCYRPGNRCSAVLQHPRMHALLACRAYQGNRACNTHRAVCASHGSSHKTDMLPRASTKEPMRAQGGHGVGFKARRAP